MTRRWDAFWFSEGPSWPLAAFRVLFALACAMDVSSSRLFATYATEGGFHLPFATWIPHLGEGAYGAIHVVQYPLLALLALGVWTRGAAAVLACLQGYVLFADQLDFRNHAYLIFLVTLLFAVVPASEAVTARALWAAWRSKKPLREAFSAHVGPLLRQRLIQVQVTLVYVFAGLHKLTDAYLHGRVLAGNWQTWIRLPALAAQTVTPQALALPAAMTVCLELLLPFALWNRKTQRYAAAIGVVFHAALWVAMDIRAFALVMVASYVLFLWPRTQRTAQVAYAP